MTKPGQKISEKSKVTARERNRRWRANNKEKAAAYHTAYYKMHKKRLQQYARERYRRLREDQAFRARLAATQRRYYHRKKSKEAGEEEAIVRQMQVFQQAVLAARQPGWYDNQGGEKRSHHKKESVDGGEGNGGNRRSVRKRGKGSNRSSSGK